MKRNPKYYIEHKLKPPKAFFDWCYSQIHTFKWSNKSKTILASDRKNCFVVEKRLTKRTNLSFFDKFYSFAIILVTEKRIEIQSYGFWSEVKEGNQTIEMRLINFEKFANDKHIKVTDQYGQYFVYGLSRNYYFGGAYTDTIFYPNNWEEKLKKKSELRYLNFDNNYDIDIERFYKYRREIEFAQKINASVLAEEIMYPRYSYSACSITANVDMRTINEKWLRNNKRFFKNSKRSFMSYELENRIRARGGKVVPGIEKYIDYRDVNYIPKGIGLVRFQNWIIKNKIDFKYYRDYLSLLKDLKINVDSENLIIPKDLTKAHNNAVELLIQMKIEIEEKAYIERLKQAKNYETAFDGFSFIFPKELNDLVVEGKTLHHCVGGSNYVEGHKTGRTTIIFIRRSDEIDKPFYTMEFNHNQIIQVRGKHNKDATVDVNKAVDKWLAWKLKNKKKRSAA